MNPSVMNRTDFSQLFHDLRRSSSSISSGRRGMNKKQITDSKPDNSRKTLSLLSLYYTKFGSPLWWSLHEKRHVTLTRKDRHRYTHRKTDTCIHIDTHALPSSCLCLSSHQIWKREATKNKNHSLVYTKGLMFEAICSMITFPRPDPNVLSFPLCIRIHTYRSGLWSSVQSFRIFKHDSRDSKSAQGSVTLTLTLGLTWRLTYKKCPHLLFSGSLLSTFFLFVFLFLQWSPLVT